MQIIVGGKKIRAGTQLDNACKLYAASVQCRLVGRYLPKFQSNINSIGRLVEQTVSLRD